MKVIKKERIVKEREVEEQIMANELFRRPSYTSSSVNIRSVVGSLLSFDDFAAQSSPNAFAMIICLISSKRQYFANDTDGSRLRVKCLHPRLPKIGCNQCR